jgi:GT2 family glycosyltransferase
MTDLSVVFVNYRTKEDILCALKTVVADAATSPFKVAVTVVDNSSNSDHIKEDLEKLFPTVRYIDAGGNVGFGKGNTLGFKAEPARYYFALNRDTLIPENKQTLERLIRFMDEHPKVGIAGPKLLYPDGRLQYSSFRFDFFSILVKPLKHLHAEEKLPFLKRWIDRLQMADFDHNSTRPVDWILGAALIARATAVEEVGFFDERYFMYLEDCDWCHSMWQKGFEVYYIHDIEITHTYERASSKVPGLRALFVNKVARIHAASWVKYLLKWFFKHRSYAR